MIGRLPYPQSLDPDAVLALMEAAAVQSQRASITAMINDGVDPDAITAIEDTFAATLPAWRVATRRKIVATLKGMGVDTTTRPAPATEH